MKVSQEKYNAIKKARGSIASVGAKFGVSDKTVRLVRGSLDYKAYKGTSTKTKKKSLTNAEASGKKKAGSSSSTSKTKSADKTKSELKTKTTDKQKTTTKPKAESKTTKKKPAEVVETSSPVESLVGKTKINEDGTVDLIDPENKDELKAAYNELYDRYSEVVEKYVVKCGQLDRLRRTSLYELATIITLAVVFIIALIF